MTRATSFRVKHIEGGFVTVQMTQSEKARCADRCAGMGAPTLLAVAFKDKRLAEVAAALCLPRMCGSEQ